MCFANKILMTLIILILSPFDLIPECVFGIIGLIDDFFYIIFALAILTKIFLSILTKRDERRY